MERIFKELIDVEGLKNMVQSNYEISHVPIGIIDSLTGEIYAAVGWQRICTDFHRLHPEAEKICIKSDTHLREQISAGDACAYKCKHGLWDIGIPIICAEQHIATIFLGQFFYEGEERNIRRFTQNAETFGFNVRDYLAALEEVPVFSQKTVDRILEYNKSLAAFLSTLSTEKYLLKKETLQRKHAETRYLDLFANMSSGVVYQEKTGEISLANPAARKILGLADEEMIGRCLNDPQWQIIRPDGSYFKAGDHPSMRALESGRPVHDTLMGVFNPRMSEFRWILVNAIPEFRKGEKEPHRVFTTFTDITDRIQAEKKLKATHKNLEKQVLERTRDLMARALEQEAIFNNSRVGMMLVGDGIVYKCNQRLADIFGYASPREMEGLHVSALHINEERFRLFGQKYWGMLDQGRGVQTEYELKRKDGEIIWCLLSGKVFGLNSPSELENKRLWVIDDITERKRMAQELDRSNKELEQFAYVASHDLQEPLRAVVSFLQLLKSRYGDRLDEKGIHYIERSVMAGHRMQAMIQDLLLLSRVNSRGNPFTRLDLNDILSRVVENLDAKINQHNAEITIGKLPDVCGDAYQIESLFQNLIINSLKYNDKSRPVINISVENEFDHFRFRIKDNGIGIDTKFHHKIFQIFQRLHTSREISGTGIGLALCKKIVEHHGGRIWVDSMVSKGSTFYFTLSKKKRETC